ncbi:MAG: copper amine oxidase N-terminal domain-containing protein [Hydrogenibacillus schlegelii]|uniref:Copper amine oxidase N-terminal domain-containing protein n=1 Tax=Hydrogenibacillus schlegelii TaxID=1484 RepID=A0A947CTK6_HYDSH|nr:copper amine oxidase N-terminal domain-containing protein [Hydrogenibacillus schlegelii]
MKGSKALSIVLTLALVLVFLPVGAFTASAAGTVTWAPTGNLKVFPNKNLKDQVIEISLKIDPWTAQSKAVLYLEDDGGNQFAVDPNNTTSSNNALTIKPNTNNKVIEYDTGANPTNQPYYDTLTIKFPNTDQIGTGNLYLVVEGLSGQFVNDKVIVGKFEKLAGNVRVVSSSAFGEDQSGKVTFNISEPSAGTFAANDKIVVKLPDGFEWSSALVAGSVTSISGPNNIVGSGSGDVVISASGRDLTIEIKTATGTQINPDRYIFNFDAKVAVADKNVASKGDVTAYVIGASPSTVVVGKYGDYQVKVSGDDQQELWAGRKVEDYQRVGKIVLDEMLPGTLVAGRTITITLPSGSWWDVDINNLKTDTKGNFKLDASGHIDYPGNAAKLKFVKFDKVNSDEKKYRVAVFEVVSGSAKAGKTVIPVQKVAVDAGFKDEELKVSVGGTAGANGEAVIAKIKQFVEVKANNKTEVFIGAREQAAGDIVIKELYPGMIRSGQVITIDAGDFTVRFDAATAEVVEGDLVIGKVTLSNNNKKIEIPVRKASTKESTIVVKGIKVTIDRTAPEGDEDSSVDGTALFDYGSKAVAAYKIVTPADRTRTVTAKFTIDSMKYIVDGQEKAMDVAPFIKDNRTFVPVKYVAEALGVKESDIIWNPYAKSVTIFKGDRVIQMKIGSKTLLVNGATLEMDTAPEIKDARTVLPIAWVAKALNVDYVWNDAERSVEFNYVAR